jgi:hypothetical protein
MVSFYYYLGAQLQSIIYGQPVPVSSMDFLEMALNEMSPVDAKNLEYCTLEPIPQEQLYTANVSSRFIQLWHNWEEVLRQNLAKNRSMKLKREDAGSFDNAPEDPPDAVAAAKNALGVDSPLEAEFILDKARWSAIDSIIGVEYFTPGTIYGYLLKLKLMERRLIFDAEEGFTEYKKLYSSILANTGGPV